MPLYSSVLRIRDFHQVNEKRVPPSVAGLLRSNSVASSRSTFLWIVGRESAALSTGSPPLWIAGRTRFRHGDTGDIG